MQKHEHAPVRERGPYGYTGPVYKEPFTHENRAAHGGVMYVQECICGFERPYLVNHPHVEWGVWQEAAAMRHEREERERQEQKRVRRIEAFQRMSLATGHRIGDDIVLVSSASAEQLADDSEAPIVVRLRMDGWRDRPTTIGALYAATQDWADGPADDPRTQIYTAIGQALP